MEFYVYRWFFKSTNETFYVGKGKDKRIHSLVHRNAYFMNIIKKYKDDVDSEIVYANLSEDESFEIEMLMIAYYWSIGQCKANFHEGGRGGNTGNYDSPERSRKLSESAKKRVGPLNPMYGKTHGPKAIAKIKAANVGKKLSKEHIEKLIKANTGRKKTEYELKLISERFKGKPLSKEQYKKMVDGLCHYLYQVFDGDVKVFECQFKKQLDKFCEETYGLSRTIVWELLEGTWKPKFNRHMKAANVSIKKIDVGVTTNGDECNHVGRGLAPLEVRSNQDMVDEIVCPDGNING